MPAKTSNRLQFPLFQTPIDLAHQYWQKVLKQGDTVIDATCGNGHDAAALAEMLESCGGGSVVAIDLQHSAIEASKERCSKWLSSPTQVAITFINGSHTQFPQTVISGSIALIVYNLGYLPGGDKAVTTLTSSTLESLEKALELIRHGGAISITCYPGHEEGKREEERLLEFVAGLSPEKWSCCHHRWLNRRNAPSLLLIQRA